MNKDYAKADTITFMLIVCSMIEFAYYRCMDHINRNATLSDVAVYIIGLMLFLFCFFGMLLYGSKTGRIKEEIVGRFEPVVGVLLLILGGVLVFPRLFALVF